MEYKKNAGQNSHARPISRVPCFMFHVLCLIFLLSSPLFAGVDSKLVAKAEIYLNGITGLSGEFSQAAGGKRDKGVFSMLRPGRVRLDYSTLPVQLVSNGKDLYFYDKSLDQITTVPLTSTPAGILVRKKINLTTADIVVSETMSTPNSFSLNIHIRGQEGAGRMRVDFSQNPVALKSWVVYDATGMETEIVFVDMKIKTDFPKNYFELQRHKMTSNSGGDDFYE